MRFLTMLSILFIMFSAAGGLSSANPAYITPDRMLLMSSEYSYDVFPFEGSAGDINFWSQRIGLRLAHSWFKHLELAIVFGGADLNVTFPGESQYNGSWELLAGANGRLEWEIGTWGRSRIKTLLDGKFILVRSWGDVELFSQKYNVFYSWREFSTDAILALKYRNIIPYIGVRAIFINATGTWHAKVGLSLTGYKSSIRSSTIVRPVIGFNWDIKDNYVLDVEILPVFWKNNQYSFSIGVSHFN